jgi:hypothetical protein
MLMDDEKDARAFALGIPDRRDRLFDELAAGDLLAGEKA